MREDQKFKAMGLYRFYKKKSVCMCIFICVCVCIGYMYLLTFHMDIFLHVCICQQNAGQSFLSAALTEQLGKVLGTYRRQKEKVCLMLSASRKRNGVQHPRELRTAEEKGQ